MLKGNYLCDNVIWCVEYECFVSEPVPSEDGRLRSKRLKACLNGDLLCCCGHNIHIGTTVWVAT